MMRNLLVACAFVVGMHSTPETNAASCGFESLEPSLTRDLADVVFDGIVLDVQSVLAGEVVTLEVVQVWKGDVSKRITIYNTRPVSNIDSKIGVSGFMQFEKAQRYVVFAHRMTPDERALFGLSDARESSRQLERSRPRTDRQALVRDESSFAALDHSVRAILFGRHSDRLRRCTPKGGRHALREGWTTTIRVCAALFALSVAFGSVNTPLVRVSAQEQSARREGATMPESKRMADGKAWTTANLNVNTPSSYCYDEAGRNCRRYGRLYTWESAQRACKSLGDGWRLPTDDEWLQLAKLYGGLGDDSADKGKAAYTALVRGGRSGFDAVLGGIRERDGKYSRLEAHGVYWTASENNPKAAPFYNFGKGSTALYRGTAGDKQRAISARCVKD
jgi:uncharacterized protein (TIGR02145 family)